MDLSAERIRQRPAMAIYGKECKTRKIEILKESGILQRKIPVDAF